MLDTAGGCHCHLLLCPRLLLCGRQLLLRRLLRLALRCRGLCGAGGRALRARHARRATSLPLALALRSFLGWRSRGSRGRCRRLGCSCRCSRARGRSSGAGLLLKLRLNRLERHDTTAHADDATARCGRRHGSLRVRNRGGGCWRLRHLRYHRHGVYGRRLCGDTKTWREGVRPRHDTSTRPASRRHGPPTRH